TVQLAGQYAMDQDGNALADIPTNILMSDGRSPQRFLHTVGGTLNVDGSVEHSAVEIAQDGPKSAIHCLDSLQLCTHRIDGGLVVRGIEYGRTGNESAGTRAGNLGDVVHFHAAIDL